MDFDASLRLLAAVVKLWRRDARQDPQELVKMATWLVAWPLEPAAIERLIGGELPPAAPEAWPEPEPARRCPSCGAGLPPTGTSRQKYCSATCRVRAHRRKAAAA